MAFIVTLIALLVERFFDWSHFRCWHWYSTLQQWVIKKRAGKQSANTASILTLVFLLAVTMLIDYLLVGRGYGLLALAFRILVLIYCLGPHNLWADTIASINALTTADLPQAAIICKNTFGIIDANDKQTLCMQLLKKIFIAAHCRVFAVLFWYVLFGVIGAVLYRALTYAISTEEPQQNTTPAFTQNVRALIAILDWLTIRIFTFIFALGGHFSQVLHCWQQQVLRGPANNEIILENCGLAALGVDMSTTTANHQSTSQALTGDQYLSSAISLLDRVFIITLVGVAIAVLFIAM